MELIRVTPRKALLEDYIKKDVEKKEKRMPPDLEFVLDKDDPNIWDAYLKKYGFKYGCMPAFKKWAFTHLSLSDFLSSAIYAGVFKVGYQNINDLYKGGEICSWKPPHENKKWLQLGRPGEVFTEDLAIIMRPAVPSEASKWYVEDGSGRVVCYIQKIFKYQEKESCAGFAYVGFDIDINSEWIKNFNNNFFIINRSNYDSVEKIL